MSLPSAHELLLAPLARGPLGSVPARRGGFGRLRTTPGLRGLGTARNGCIWPLVIGMRKAKELYFTGDTVTGVEAADIGMINYAWPAAELEEKTLAFAERIAILSSDHLALLKLTMNRFYENMGIHSSIRSATEQDVMAQMTEFAYEFGRKFEEDGMKAAVEWRDRPYARKGY